ncbi:uncharacterized protein Z518_00386 [Rhinocladiella mackenziei CBS 650.93]|uniref:Rhinocladiella mackenziei CBS 650.93 unplaced genomic scaffold supercont1.1, whole genome shotgun sequence n=1 Tax=Rhinocladiella mackenziei CBS 650.93 TaxID=1442369 RepID=A0A0D2G3V3_9EURO|nr:uncharacterized protein Z518_00386 [Rhinocladiella mackenziei CBS 650.93]KIX09307.1 hypothetical protein Z518_00386 [Rhinocladiella mackenziei CBS 650.93]
MPTAVEINTFYHQSQLVNADYESVVRPNAETLYSMAFLDLAGSGLQDAMTLLLENGHDPDPYTADGQTPLLWAANKVRRVSALHMTREGEGGSETFWNRPPEEAWRSGLCNGILDMFDKLFGKKEDAVLPLHQCTRVYGIASYALHMTALFAQMFSVGLVTYSGGHGSDLYMARISRTIKRFRLLGVMPTASGTIVERVELSCLGGLVLKPVWAFKLDPIPELTAWTRGVVDPGSIYRVRHDIEARICQLLDIWDTTIVIDDKPVTERVKLRMGNGFSLRSQAADFLIHGTR